MRRREFIALLSGMTAAWPLAPLCASAQDAVKLARVGILDRTAPGQYNELYYWSAFREQMRVLGYIEGKNVQFDVRWGNHDLQRLPSLAAELVRLPVDLIVALSTPVALAARSVTSTVPIIVPLMADPVGVGLVASLARPGRNVTGLSTISAVLSAKCLELLREFVPTMTRAAVLWDDTNPSFKLTVHYAEAAAQSMGISIEVVGLHAAGGIENAITAIVGSGAQGLILAVGAGASLLSREEDLARVTAILERQRLPTVYLEKEYVHSGGLASYGPSNIDLLRRAATYADQILRGANPADLPVQEPTKFELSINLKTAKALNLAIPSSLLARADEVIE
jgi:ABC-type uncharacterized transport system substrate-binding protein